jgi:hypothetical protein
MCYFGLFSDLWDFEKNEDLFNIKVSSYLYKMVESKISKVYSISSIIVKFT